MVFVLVVRVINSVDSSASFQACSLKATQADTGTYSSSASIQATFLSLRDSR
jgi:hypothetical protein